ncbi:FHA domain-containing protein [Metasolibacillus meyeri]|uniref:FHA domain-containing protein n=1 Tax=Metasolibacillus meyeri TaxID=1071052 RepID=A0AAW9NUS2_9BACL|nr:FHA domain-containing protein [Metasolibacillus meyeri]MEC1180043.1 FHA domain-containing protein [Metasolibacillus meyeri]
MDEWTNLTNTYKKRQQADVAIKIIDILLLIVSVFLLLYIFVLSQAPLLQILSIVIIVAGGTAFLIYSYITANKKALAQTTDIEKLVLLNEQGQEVLEWSLKNQTSLLIGKKTVDYQPEIDLSHTEYAALINTEHALLNCVDGIWYVEDVDSVNGVGIRKPYRHLTQKLKQENPYPIGYGDILYIANTKIIAK